MLFQMLVVKETRAGELRVGLTPADAKKLVSAGHTVFVEHDAGKGAGFSNNEYEKAGAKIRVLDAENREAYKNFFKDINMIVRVKRPHHARELLENQVIQKNTIMIGALDPLERHSEHLSGYHKAGIIAYSVDQMELSLDDPMNILAAMSKIAGKLALLDAINKSALTIKKVVIIGFGVVGRSAFAEAIDKKIHVNVFVTNDKQKQEVEIMGGEAIVLDKDVDLKSQQQSIQKNISDADIIITSARKPNQAAPLLIPRETIEIMQSGAVIVDMALSEGGNVEGSEHDATHVFANGVIVTNVSGYPKAMPHEASILWSNANFHFIMKLAMNEAIPLQPC